MTLKHYLSLVGILLVVLLIWLGQSILRPAGPDLTRTASGTWMSPREQGSKEVVLTTTNVQDGQDLMAMTILDVTTGYLPKGELLMRPDESGKQIIRLAMKVANVGTKEANFRYDRLAVRLKNGTEGTLSFFVNQSNAQDFLQSKMMEPGDVVEGALYLELPAGALRTDLMVEYRGEKATTPLGMIR